MFQIIDTKNNHIPVKSGFMTAAQALKWARKNLGPDLCDAFGKITPDRRYFIKRHR
jgi:hypothetical protein